MLKKLKSKKLKVTLPISNHGYKNYKVMTMERVTINLNVVDFEAGKTEELYQGYFFSNYQAAAAKKQILEPRNSRRTEKKVTKTTTPVRAETTSSRSRRKVQVQNKEDDDWGQGIY